MLEVFIVINSMSNEGKKFLKLETFVKKMKKKTVYNQGKFIANRVNT